MYFIEKDFGDFPCAHRQPRHGGHCKLLHGHNFCFKVKLAAEKVDEQGFIIDFGEFGELKAWLTEVFDHTLLLQTDDPQLEFLSRTLGDTGLAKIQVLDSVSAEGLAFLFFNVTLLWLKRAARNLPVKLVSVTVHEDWKNSATYSEE